MSRVCTRACTDTSVLSVIGESRGMYGNCTAGVVSFLFTKGSSGPQSFKLGYQCLCYREGKHKLGGYNQCLGDDAFE